MSGIELAQIIREKESIQSDTHIPILALTANLYHEQLVNPKEAGFDDVLIKPFMERDLFEKMKVLLAAPPNNILSEENSATQEIETEATQTGSIKNPNALYSLDYLNKTSGSNKEFVADMIKSFIKNNNEHLAKLNSALEQNDFDTIMRVTHKMIPSYSYLEIKSLIPELKLVKKYADEKINLDKLPALINNISTVSLLVMDQLKSEETKLNLEINKSSSKEISNN
jgi:CheY-like chemotaxis protein